MDKVIGRVAQPVPMKPGQDISGNRIPVTGNEATFGHNGYPNDVPSTQTVKTRGTGAATNGTNSSKKLG